MYLVGETTRLVDEGILATDGKHFWLTDRAPVAPVKPAQLEAGYYLLDGEVCKVQISKSSDKPYAKILNTEGRFDYAPRAVADLRPEHRVTLEQAREWGKINGRCMICAAEADQPRVDRVRHRPDLPQAVRLVACYAAPGHAPGAAIVLRRVVAGDAVDEPRRAGLVGQRPQRRQLHRRSRCARLGRAGRAR